MLFILPLLVILLHQDSVHGCIKDNTNYTAFELSLLTNENLMKLQPAFFPTNYQASIVVNVVYHFTEPDSNNEEIVLQQDHRILRDVNYMNVKSSNFDEKNFTFRWMASPINMFCRPSLLKQLSLYTFQAKVSTVHLTLERPCEMGRDDTVLMAGSDVCTNIPEIKYLLNNLTSNLLSYTIHRTSSMSKGIDSRQEKGFSVYSFNPDNPSDYCVLDQTHDYSRLRFCINLASGFLGLFLMIATPMVLVSVFEKFKKKMEKAGTNTLFFVWATVIVSLIAAISMYAENFLTYIKNISVYPSSSDEEGYNDIYKYFHEMFAILIVIAIGDFVCTTLGIMYMYKTGKLNNDFPIPGLMKCIFFCACSTTEPPAPPNTAATTTTTTTTGNTTTSITITGNTTTTTITTVTAPTTVPAMTDTVPTTATAPTTVTAPTTALVTADIVPDTVPTTATAPTTVTAPTTALATADIVPDTVPTTATAPTTALATADIVPAQTDTVPTTATAPTTVTVPTTAAPTTTDTVPTTTDTVVTTAVTTTDTVVTTVPATAGASIGRGLILLIGSYSFTIFLQLSSFHAQYIVLGSIASPIETLSLTSFYVASYFTLIAFTAFFLKITHGLNRATESVYKRYILMCILPLLSAIVFIACAVFFVLFFVFYTLMVQGYRNNNGAIGIIGNILPAAFVSLAGFGGTRLIKCMGRKKENINNVAIAGPAAA